MSGILPDVTQFFSPGSLCCAWPLSEIFFAHTSSWQILVQISTPAPSPCRAFSVCSTWCRPLLSTFSYCLSTPSSLFCSPHLALWVMSCSIKILTFVNHAFCFSQSKERTSAFEFLIRLLLIAFSVQKSFQTPTKPFSLVEICRIIVPRWLLLSILAFA